MYATGTGLTAPGRVQDCGHFLHLSALVELGTSKGVDNPTHHLEKSKYGVRQMPKDLQKD